ncbi:hypothetical protein KAR91_54770 [Candidatus Pacearchaeota archaeon]|nr:hypothetical protein [Candidatus Pacearchaeota archaeon]
MAYGRIGSINIPSGTVQWLGIYGSYLLASNGSTIYKYNLSDYSLAGNFSVLACGPQSYIDGDVLWIHDYAYFIYKYDLISETLTETYRVVLDNTGGFPWSTAVMVTEAVSNNPPYDSSPWIHLNIDCYAKTDYGHFFKEDGYAIDLTFTNAFALGTVQSPNDSAYPDGTAVTVSGEVLFTEGDYNIKKYNESTGAFIGNVSTGGTLSADDLFKSDKIYGAKYSGHIAQSGVNVFCTNGFSIHTLGLSWEEDVVFGSPAANIGIFGSPPDTPTNLTAQCTQESVPAIPGFTIRFV